MGKGSRSSTTSTASSGSNGRNKEAKGKAIKSPIEYSDSETEEVKSIDLDALDREARAEYTRRIQRFNERQQRNEDRQMMPPPTLPLNENEDGDLVFEQSDGEEDDQTENNKDNAADSDLDYDFDRESITRGPVVAKKTYGLRDVVKVVSRKDLPGLQQPLRPPPQKKKTPVVNPAPASNGSRVQEAAKAKQLPNIESRSDSSQPVMTSTPFRAARAVEPVYFSPVQVNTSRLTAANNNLLLTEKVPRGHHPTRLREKGWKKTTTTDQQDSLSTVLASVESNRNDDLMLRIEQGITTTPRKSDRLEKKNGENAGPITQPNEVREVSQVQVRGSFHVQNGQVRYSTPDPAPGSKRPRSEDVSHGKANKKSNRGDKILEDMQNADDILRKDIEALQNDPSLQNYADPFIQVREIMAVPDPGRSRGDKASEGRSSKVASRKSERRGELENDATEKLAHKDLQEVEDAGTSNKRARRDDPSHGNANRKSTRRDKTPERLVGNDMQNGSGSDAATEAPHSDDLQDDGGGDSGSSDEDVDEATNVQVNNNPQVQHAKADTGPSGKMLSKGKTSDRNDKRSTRRNKSPERPVENESDSESDDEQVHNDPHPIVNNYPRQVQAHDAVENTPPRGKVSEKGRPHEESPRKKSYVRSKSPERPVEDDVVSNESDSDSTDEQVHHVPPVHHAKAKADPRPKSKVSTSTKGKTQVVTANKRSTRKNKSPERPVEDEVLSNGNEVDVSDEEVLHASDAEVNDIPQVHHAKTKSGPGLKSKVSTKEKTDVENGNKRSTRKNKSPERRVEDDASSKGSGSSQGQIIKDSPDFQVPDTILDAVPSSKTSRKEKVLEENTKKRSRRNKSPEREVEDDASSKGSSSSQGQIIKDSPEFEVPDTISDAVPNSKTSRKEKVLEENIRKRSRRNKSPERRMEDDASSKGSGSSEEQVNDSPEVQVPDNISDVVPSGRTSRNEKVLEENTKKRAKRNKSPERQVENDASSKGSGSSEEQVNDSPEVQVPDNILDAVPRSKTSRQEKVPEENTKKRSRRNKSPERQVENDASSKGSGSSEGQMDDDPHAQVNDSPEVQVPDTISDAVPSSSKTSSKEKVLEENATKRPTRATRRNKTPERPLEKGSGSGGDKVRDDPNVGVNDIPLVEQATASNARSRAAKADKGKASKRPAARNTTPEPDMENGTGAVEEQPQSPSSHVQVPVSTLQAGPSNKRARREEETAQDNANKKSARRDESESPEQPGANQLLSDGNNVASQESRQSFYGSQPQSQALSTTNRLNRRSRREKTRVQESKTKRPKKREKTPERYVGNDVFGNYRIMDENQIKAILRVEPPPHELSPEQLNLFTARINHYLEDFFNYLCNDTEQPYGFFTFSRLYDELIRNKVLPESTSPASFRKLMKTKMSEADFIRSRGVLLPDTPASEPFDTVQYLLG